MRRIILSLFFLPIVVGLWISNCHAEGALEVSLSRQVGAVSYQPLDDNKILASVLDSNGETVLGLTKEDFVIKRGPQTAQILSVQDYAESRDTGLNIVLVVDNSFSMEMRKAVNPLLEALQSFISYVRPIDNVHIVVFTNPKSTEDPATNNVATRVFQSNNPAALNQFLKESFEDTTDGTYLYDAMVVGLGIIHQMPSEKQKFMMVFSDGEDINSRAKSEDVAGAASNLDNFSAYAIDYMDKPEVDPFLKSFALTNSGEIRKARSASDFLPILKAFSTTIFHRYIINYRFNSPPEGTLSLDPSMITIEELTIVDSSPLLNHIYFDTGKTLIPTRYVSITSPEEMRAFDEEKLQGTMEKYQNVLNIIGKRMANHPEASLTLVGCVSDTGVEKDNITLSRNRAEAVAAYLGMWGIDPSRMTIKAQKLPAVPSTTRVPEGVVENQRVEITSDDMAILDTVKSTYFEEQVDTKEVRVQLSVHAEAGIKNCQVTLLGDGTPLKKIEYQGEPPASITFDLDSVELHTLASLGQITARLDVIDKEEGKFTTESIVPIQIKFIKREERIAQKMGYRVMERYALILFEFDRAEIKQQNQIIMDRIISRIKGLSSSQVQIIGHTDIIGTEQYNLPLSERRAKAAYDLIMAADLSAGTTVNHQGVGPQGPPYDNALPEGRAYNRTVVITVNYEATGM
ncbi:MAG: hypothetical protein A2521_02010 [Deltaproteobacteria bacterium RIFOXYD12_FULL_57_12]|nr:MAG: hypothetical protein A2521_02010 [Deltaproteobacteria bacterium RIFOXYD12_FULL_57_12]